MATFGVRTYFWFMGANWSVRLSAMTTLLHEIKVTGAVPDITAAPYNARRVKRIPKHARHHGRYHRDIEPQPTRLRVE